MVLQYFQVIENSFEKEAIFILCNLGVACFIRDTWLLVVFYGQFMIAD